MEVFSIFRRRVPKLRCRRCAWCETSWRDSRFRFGRRVVFHVAFFWVISCHIMVQPLGIAQSVAMFCWWFGTFWLFVSVGNVIIPTDELIFFRGVQTTNQLEFVEGHWSFLFIVGCASVEIRGNRVESINLTHISFHTIKWDIQYIYIYNCFFDPFTKWDAPPSSPNWGYPNIAMFGNCFFLLPIFRTKPWHW